MSLSLGFKQDGLRLALCGDDGRIRLTLRHLTGLFSLLLPLFDYKLRLECQLLSDLLSLHCRGVLVTEANVAEQEIIHHQVIFSQTLSYCIGNGLLQFTPFGADDFFYTELLHCIPNGRPRHRPHHKVFKPVLPGDVQVH